MEPPQIMRLVERLRWLFPRHTEVLQAAGELESLARAEAHRIALRAVVEADPRFRCSTCGSSGDVTVLCSGCQNPIRRRVRMPKRDRALYMRDYRRRQRA